MARLLSVNVGFPRDIVWKGRTVHTGVWKNPVTGRCRVGRLNLEGDGQGDLTGPSRANPATECDNVTCPGDGEITIRQRQVCRKANITFSAASILGCARQLW